MLLFDLLRSFKNRNAKPVSFRLRASGFLRRAGIDQRTREEQDRAIHDLIELIYPAMIYPYKPGEKEGLDELLIRGGEEAVFGYVKGRVWNFDAAFESAFADIQFLLEKDLIHI